MSRRSVALAVYLLPKGLPSPTWHADMQPLASNVGELMFQSIAILSS